MKKFMILIFLTISLMYCSSDNVISGNSENSAEIRETVKNKLVQITNIESTDIEPILDSIDFSSTSIVTSLNYVYGDYKFEKLIMLVNENGMNFTFSADTNYSEGLLPIDLSALKDIIYRFSKDTISNVVQKNGEYFLAGVDLIIDNNDSTISFYSVPEDHFIMLKSSNSIYMISPDTSSIAILKYYKLQDGIIPENLQPYSQYYN